MNIVGKRYWFFLISGISLLAGIISLAVFGLRPGVEFTSGSLLTVGFEQEVSQDDLKRELASLGYTSALVQRTGEDDFLVQLPELDTQAKNSLLEGLEARFGAPRVGEFDTISAVVAAETTRYATIAILAAAAGILLYLTWAFRRMPHPVRYGTCAVIALLHDIVLVVGLFALFGRFLGWEINLMFVTGILAILGYSVNNIVIIFDRIRENVLQGRGDFETTVNGSIVQTLGRSLNTNLTTTLPVIALLLIVGASIQNLLVVLFAGIIIGTYDSICVAPSLLVVWQKGEWGRFIGRKTPATVK
ncbi:MAG: protein translocase subunit SecF [Chloroflexi bacterium]|nr:protein translocase subunit SecF [Chloroflexota bacterium]